jgi:predicted dehydrogenase
VNEITIGLAGAGYWGSKLARNIFEAKGGRLAAICDPDTQRLESAVARYPGCRAYSDLEALLATNDIDAVVVATPASSHAEHCRAVLEADKHVLVEKPLALSTADCEELCELASSKRLTLMVGHTFVYSEPVRMLRQLVQAGELGEILYLYGQRVNLGVIREDLNALWNFGPHDVSILLYLLDKMPLRVSAHQYAVLNRSLEDIAFLVLEFPGGVVGHIHDSWLDPRKVRQFTVVGDRKMAVYDDTDVEAPLRIYDKGVAPAIPVRTTDRPFQSFAQPVAPEEHQGYGEFKLEVRAGDILVPRVNAREPLSVEIEHFIECVRSDSRPCTDGRHGRDVVAVLEAAERSAREGRAVAMQLPGAAVREHSPAT